MRAWKTATHDDLPLLRAYLEANLAAVPGDRLRRHGMPSRRSHRFHLLPEGNRIAALLYQGASGFFYPVDLGGTDDRSMHALRRAIGPFPRVYSVMGRSADVSRFDAIIRRSPSHVVDYHLMRFSQTTVVDNRDPPFPGLSVRRVGREASERLLPLQIAYEREEVLLPGREINIAVSRTVLMDSLVNQLVLVAERDDVVVARVATNARGFGCDQVGGVYVDPEFRRRGVAQWLMKKLIEQIQTDGKETTLFVKPDNRAAMRLYGGLRFTVEGAFRISYYW